MKELDLALEILNDDLDKGKHFNDALSDVFKKRPEERPYRADVSGLLGCELRHHELFTYLLNSNEFEEFTVEDKRVASLGLANDYFFRHFERSKMDEAIKEKLGEEKFAKLLPLLDKSGNPESYIPESVERSSNLFLTLRYNIPEWLLKILLHEGHAATYKTIREFQKRYVNFVRVTNALNPETLGEDFKGTEIKGIYAYEGKTPLRKLDDLKDKVFEERPYVKMVYDMMGVPSAQNILLYAGQDGDEWELEMLESASEHSNVNIASQNIEKKGKVLKAIKDKGLKNVNFFEAKNPDEMVAAISANCDVAIIAPRCSQFDRIASAPDYLLHFNADSMKEVYDMQIKALAGCAKHVEQGGRMIYCLPTISRKEGRRTVEAFLREHPEFTLDEQKQFFPFESMKVAFYYAVLYKGEKAKAEGGAQFIEAINSQTASVASAESK